MSIIIRIKATGEIFDLPNPFALEEKNTSPIFNILGSKTVTSSIPRTPNNSRLFGFANRLDTDLKPNAKINVIVSSGSYTREGVLCLSSPSNTTSTYGITIAFNEGIMFEAMENLPLSQLKLPVIEFGENDVIDYLNNLFTTDELDKELSVFPVNLILQKYTSEFEGNEFEGLMYVSLNQPEGVGMGGGVKLYMHESADIVVDGKLETVSVPRGYGITPFVRVWHLLELIFEHFGYKINKNPFKEHFQLKRLCVLNNVVDTIVQNEIDYAQLMPNVTVMEFLNSLYCRFGLKIFFDGNRNEVNLRLLKDIFNSKEVGLINLGSEIDPDLATATQLKLSAATNLDKSETEFETYEEFLSKYNSMFDIAIEHHSIKNPGIAYYIKTGLFYHECLSI